MPDKNEALAAAVRTSLYACVRKAFETLNPSDEFLDSWHIHAMVHALERCVRGNCKRLIITLPPRHLKSLTASVAFPAWLMGHDPSARVMCISYADPLAMLFARQFREVVSARWYRRAFPQFRLSTKNTEQEIVTTRQGYRLSSSFRGSLTGRGAQYIIIDDPQKTNEAMSESERQYAIDTFKNTISSRLNNQQSGVIILVMQRVHYEDLAGYLLETGKWEHLNLPAIAEEDVEIRISDDEIHKRKKDSVLHPALMSIDSLMDCKERDPHVFSTQYQQNPAPIEGNTIKREWIRRYKDRPPRDKCDLIVQSWDTASGEGEHASYSVGQTWGIIEGRAYLLDQVRGRFTYPELKAIILRQAKIFGADRILIEKSSAGLALLQDLSGKHNLNFIPIVPRLDKETRCHQATGLMEAGRVYFPEYALWLATVEAEIFGFPYTKFTDQVDAMTQFLLWWKDFKKDGPTVDMDVTVYRGGRILGRKSTYYDRMGGSFPR